jgi:hypothetical protein
MKKRLCHERFGTSAMAEGEMGKEEYEENKKHIAQQEVF